MQGYWLNDQEFITLWKKIGSPSDVAKELKCDIRSVYNRRRSIEFRLGIELPTTKDARYNQAKQCKYHGSTISWCPRYAVDHGWWIV